MKKQGKRKTIAALFAMVLVMTLAAPMFVSAAATPGGWTVSEATYSFLNKSQKTIFKKATKKLTGVSYEPVALLAKQTVAGTNYVYLCQGKTVTASKDTASVNPGTAWYILSANQSPKNKVTLRSTKKINISKIKTKKNPRTETMSGGLEIVKIKNKSAALPKSARKVFKKGIQKYTGYELRPVALLGTQVVSGTNYRFLCYGTGAAGNDVFVVEIYEKPNGKCSLTSCKPLNLEKYTE